MTDTHDYAGGALTNQSVSHAKHVASSRCGQRDRLFGENTFRRDVSLRGLRGVDDGCDGRQRKA